ncbi:hypothetical protein P7D77_18910 [Enterococcus avium]|uniref:hypothetical protein n=1 Tax=Enterococcus TaxID=1350 RepID=UPI001C475C46|nr:MULTISPECIES: hypothetical protein [Enterococcus]MDT2400030.1 hypothetical protein [Enterococcus avium]QXJ59396.1 hypothetical protein J9537_00990 [Enterococcus raffinosus]
MKKSEFDKLFQDAIEEVQKENFSQENLFSRLKDYANENGKLDSDGKFLFSVMESQAYTQDLLEKVLSKVLIDE